MRTGRTSTKSNRGLALRLAMVIGALALCVVALQSIQGYEPRSSAQVQPAPTAANPCDAERGRERDGEGPGPAPGGDLAVQHGEPPENPLSIGWDSLPAAERTRIQRTRFERAVAGVSDGVDVRRNVAEAQDALTALRSELYASAAGREEHRKLERQLESLLEVGDR